MTVTTQEGIELRERLRTLALALPEAWEDHPWGESVVKVRKKIFVFLGSDDGPPRMNVKLPESAPHALSLPDASPSGYGMGRHGWVNVQLSGELPAFEVLADWVRESFCAVAPKSLVALLR